MKYYLLLALLFLLTGSVRAQTPRLSPRELQEDVAILRKALEQVHPQLYRYTDKAAFDKSFAALEADTRKGMTPGEFFKRVSQIAVQVHCGHTFCNLTNQEDGWLARIFDRKMLPFYFRLWDRRLIITHNVTDNPRVKAGTEIVTLNGRPVAQVIDSLLTISKADGLNTTAHRLRALEVRRDGSDASAGNLWDVYFPLFFPLGGEWEIETVDAAGKRARFKTPTLTRAERLRVAEQRYGPPPAPESVWQFKMLDADTAYLKLGTFFTYNWKLDTKKFFDDAFATLRQRNAKHLIVDLRGNRGGFTGHGDELKKHIAPATLPAPSQMRRLVKTLRIDPSLAPHLTTYEEQLKLALGKGYPSFLFREAESGMYESKLQGNRSPVVPYPDNFRGDVYFISDAANASAASELLQDVRESKLGVIVGQETGGNGAGINTGVFFLRLPHSGIEMDLPAIANLPAIPRPDGGVKPDLPVQPSPSDWRRGIDTELEFVRRRLKTY